MASVSLDTPEIRSAAEAVRSFDNSIDWLLLSYRDTRDKLFVHATGEAGLVELKTRLGQGEILFGLLQLEKRILLFTYLPDDSVSGVRRARALVHSRAVGAAFRHDAHLTASAPDDLTLPVVRGKLRLDGSSVPPSPLIPQSPSMSPSPQFNSPYIPTSPPPPVIEPTQQRDDRPPPLPEKPPSPLINGINSLNLNGSRNNSLTGSTHSSRLSPQFQQSFPPRQSSHTNGGGSGGGTNSSSSSHPPRQQSLSSSSGPRSSPTPPDDFSAIGAFASGGSIRSHTASPTLSPHLNGNGSAPYSSTSRAASPRPEKEWRRESIEAQERRGSAGSSIGVPTPEERRGSANSLGSVKSPGMSYTAAHAEAIAAAQLAQEQREREEQEVLEADARQREAKAKEDSLRLERERKEREAAERAREAAEKDARAKWEYEERERRKLEVQERERLEKEEWERREAAERLRREEVRRVEEKERVEEGKRRKEEEERNRVAKEEMRVLVEKEREERRLREVEEVRRREEKKVREREELRERFKEKKNGGEVMLSGSVSVQAQNSVYWRRRHFELSGSNLSLYKSELDISTNKPPLETISLPNRVLRVSLDPEEAAVANSLKLETKDDEEWLFYTDQAEEQKALVEALRIAAE